MLLITILISTRHEGLFPPVLFFETLLIDIWLCSVSNYVVSDAHALFLWLSQKMGRRMSRATQALSSDRLFWEHSPQWGAVCEGATAESFWKCHSWRLNRETHVKCAKYREQNKTPYPAMCYLGPGELPARTNDAVPLNGVTRQALFLPLFGSAELARSRAPFVRCRAAVGLQITVLCRRVGPKASRARLWGEGQRFAGDWRFVQLPISPCKNSLLKWFLLKGYSLYRRCQFKKIKITPPRESYFVYGKKLWQMLLIYFISVAILSF